MQAEPLILQIQPKLSLFGGLFMVAPVVSLTKPTNGSTFTAGGEIYMLAQASDSDGSITKVEFFAGTKYLKTENTAPYECRWSSVPAGNYTLTAKATDNSGVVTTSAPIQITVQNSTWKDTVLNADGTLNRIEYSRVAKEADLNYKFGPAWSFFHPTDPGNFPTVWGRTRSDDWLLYKIDHPPLKGEASYGDYGPWFANAGNLCYRPNTDPDPGMIRAAAFADYHYAQGSDPNHWRAFHLKPFWVPERADNYVRNPDPCVQDADWLTASGGTAPSEIVAIDRAKVKWAIGAVVVFSNGLIGITGTGNDRIYFPFIKLGSGKVPTNVAVSPNNEFAFVTVWDTVNYKGQLAVIALKGEEKNSDGSQKMPMYKYFGLPSNANGTGLDLKLLGYIDLPFATPSSLSVGFDVSRWDIDRMYFWAAGTKEPNDLSTQAVRDRFAQGIDSYHQVAASGYVAVASRTEGKVAFVDLQPLLQYYRKMYLTTQSNYDATKVMGKGDNQWPYSFTYRPEQKPKLAFVLNIPQPTCLLSGFPRSSGTTSWYGDDSFRSKLYVGTLAGELRVYDVNNLMTTSAPTTPTLVKTVAIGKNPTHITTGRQNHTVNDIWVTCRGDRKIVLMKPDGTIEKTLQDSRIKDPVSVARSKGHGPNLVSVCDLAGSVHNYQVSAYNCWGFKPWGELGSDGKANFEYNKSATVPGKPFAFSVAEVT